MWGGLYTVVCTCAHRVPRQNRLPATPTARPTGFVVDVGDQDFRGHRRARAKDLKTGKYAGSGGALAAKGSCGFNTSVLVGHYNCLLLSCLWAQHLCQFGRRGGHRCIQHQLDLTWVCWWWQVTEEEVLLCQAVAAGHNFFFSALWGKATSRWRCMRLAQGC